MDFKCGFNNFYKILFVIFQYFNNKDLKKILNTI